MTNRLVNYKRTFIPSSVFMDSTPPAAHTWGLKKFNIISPTICTLNQEPVPASAPPASSPDINLNLFQHYISALKLPGISPPPAITNAPTEPIMEDIYAMHQEENDLCIKLCGLNTRGTPLLPPQLQHITCKHVSGIIREQIIKNQVRNTEYYDDHRVTLSATLLKTIKKRKYIS